MRKICEFLNMITEKQQGVKIDAKQAAIIDECLF